MQQRQPRLGDILDDYCPRERRLTNHAVVAMVGDEVKQTRCTTCDAEHEYKHARVPRPRRKDESPAALLGQPAAVPKRVVPEAVAPLPLDDRADEEAPRAAESGHGAPSTSGVAAPDESPDEPRETEGPVHRRLIRAALPRHEGQQAPGRAAPEFTIRQPGGGRPNRFRPRHARGHQGVDGNRSGHSGGYPGGGSAGRHGGGSVRGGSAGHGHGRSPAMTSRPGKPRHSGRKGPK